jgi:DNA modification methylase
MNTEKILKIKPYHKNAKKHPTKQIEAIAKSIKEYGFNQPIVVDKDNVIIVGHGRYEAAKALGMTDIPVIQVQLTEEQAKAYRLADNKLNESEWEMEKVIDELKGMSDEMVDLTGFDRDLLIEPDDKDDEVPEVSEEPKSKLGDLYELGNHRVLCGDSTKKEDVERLMDGKKALICFTSPPYWVGFSYENENEKITIIDHIKKQAGLLKEYVKSKIFINTGNIASITTAEKITGKKQVALLIDWWQDALRDNGFLLRHLRIWAKQGGIKPSYNNDKSDLHWEYIGTFTEESDNAGMVANFYNENRELQGINKIKGLHWATKGVWNDIIGTARANNHIASYPVMLPLRYLLMYSSEKDLIYEPYCGAGTNIIASEKTGRICYGMEIDPKYIDVIVQRYVDYTGNNNIKLNGQETLWEKK